MTIRLVNLPGAARFAMKRQPLGSAALMKVLVAVKRVVDHAVRIRVRADGSGVETDNVRMSMNPFDKHAVEAAVQLAETGQADEVVVVSIGPKQSTDVILTALAMGGHRGLLIEADQPLETRLAVAKLLRAVVDEEKPGLVLLGKQAVDDDSNHVGPDARGAARAGRRRRSRRASRWRMAG
jgi:electron transfer flavoprotein beta subunit